MTMKYYTSDDDRYILDHPKREERDGVARKLGRSRRAIDQRLTALRQKLRTRSEDELIFDPLPTSKQCRYEREARHLLGRPSWFEEDLPSMLVTKSR